MKECENGKLSIERALPAWQKARDSIYKKQNRSAWGKSRFMPCKEVEIPQYNPVNTHDLAPCRKHLPTPVLLSWNVIMYSIASRKASKFYHMLWFWSFEKWLSGSFANHTHFGSSGKTVALFTNHIFFSVLPAHFIKVFLAIITKWLSCIFIFVSCSCISVAHDY